MDIHNRFPTEKKSIFIFIQPESLFPVAIVRANVTKRLHRHTIEKRQNHLIRPDMCPIIELYSVNSVLWSINCSSSGRKIEDNQRRAFVIVCVGFLSREWMGKHYKIAVRSSGCVQNGLPGKLRHPLSY